jgi:hypothetical protein
MFFAGRRWATRVVKKTGFPIRSREATALIEMLIWASKQFPSRVPVAESVLMSAMTMIHNQRAVISLAEDLDGNPVAAEKALAELSEAAIAVATEHGMPDFVRLARR